MKKHTRTSRFQIRPLWLEFVKMGARLDVVAPVHDIEWWDELPDEIKLKQSSIFFTFVHFAALFHDYDLLNAAIAHRADLNVRSYLFGSPLHVACDRGDKEMAQLLLRNGAHADSVTLLCLAALYFFEIVSMYLSACQTHSCQCQW